MKRGLINVEFLHIIPFILFWLYYSGIPHLLWGYSDGESDRIRQIVLGLAYLVALFCHVFNPLVIKNLLYIKAYLLVVFYAILSILWAYAINQVFINAVHHIGLVLTLNCAVYFLLKRPEVNVFKWFFVFSLIVMMLSVFLSVLVPHVGHHVSQRWSGVYAHPNTLGLFSFFAFWSASFYFVMIPDVKVRLLCVVLALLAFVNLFFANSVTSIISCIILLLFIQFFNVKELSLSLREGYFLFAGMIFALFFTIVLVALIFPGLDVASTFFSVSGRDENLTGRTYLWILAFELIEKKFLLGWGFDSLRYFNHVNLINYNQFHNGYLDIMVKGGVVGICVFLGFVCFFLKKLYQFRGIKPVYYKAFIAFFFVVAIVNITESSFLRIGHFFWFFISFIYFYVSIILIKGPRL
ncbi:O-antigen ligase family protein [Desulfobotulus alkaliphilus]|uniref:O-antigen ligase family protein n=1 Tax=Desulfobotulus alkaliphilus TaxID=622671 RepID=UPI001FEA6282|nr:O-antigen ligase family protein [Desulfobotulus alkaliphilus]